MIYTTSARWPTSCSCSSCPTAQSRCWSKGQRAAVDRISCRRTHFSGRDRAAGRERRPARRTREIEVLRRSVDHAVRAVRQAEQEGPAGNPDLAVRHRRAGPPGRHHRRAHVAQARRQAERSRNSRRQDRLEHLLGLIEGEIDVLQIEKRIRGRVKQQMEKSQREYYLNEQMKAIQKELGDMEDAPNELEELEKKIEKRRHAQGGARKRRRPSSTS